MTGSRGPKSKPDAIRRNKPRATTALEAVRPGVPELPEGYRPETVAWWAAWLDSPQSAFFAATDWQALLRCAVLVDLFHANPSAQLAAEIRQIEAKVGAMASDRDRLGWKIEEPVARDAVPAVEGSRARPDPRRAA